MPVYLQDFLAPLLEAQPGIFSLSMPSADLPYNFTFKLTPQIDRLTDPPQPLSRGRAAALFQSALFPAPGPEEMDRIVRSTGWENRIAALSALAPPEHIAATVSTGFSLGQTPQEVARDLLPVMNNVRTSARRVARTEGMRITHDVQMKMWDGLGDWTVSFDKYGH